MARYELRTFSDIINAVMEQVKIQSSDVVSKNRIKRNINTIYLDEVVSYKQWPWLRGFTTLSLPQVINTGTASVTNNSSTVTLTISPANSLKGHYFSTNGFSEIYKIQAHTPGSSIITLEVPFAGSTSATSGYKIWKDSVTLPTDLKEVLEVSHQFNPKPLDNYGLQEFRRIVATNSKVEGRPSVYTTTDFRDPEPFSDISSLPATATRASSGLVKTVKFAATLGVTASALIRPGDRIEIAGAGDHTYNGQWVVSNLTTTDLTNDTITFTGMEILQESATADTGMVVKSENVEGYERFREMLIYPSIFSSRTTMHLDYIKSVRPLENDDDEPVLPVEDRVVLYYGALWLSWGRERNPEEANSSFQLFQRKLDRMAGKTEDSPDKPLLVPSKMYLGAKRLPTRSRAISGSLNIGGGGGSSVPVSTASRVAIFDSSGSLTASPIIDLTELSYINNVGSQVLGQSDSGTFTNKTINCDNNTVTNVKNDEIASDADITRTKLATGTAYRILANDSLGEVSENAALTPGEIVETDANGQLQSSGITTTELDYLDGAYALTSVTIPDNTTDHVVATFAHASINFIHIDYSCSRGAGNRASGIIKLATDGTSTAIAQGAEASIGTLGVTFSTEISGANIRLLATTTSTGTDVTFKHKGNTWG